MIREQAREAAAVMLAWADGKTIQCRRRSSGEWCGIEPGCTATILSWDWDEFEYRVKPEPKLRPWTADEVPVGAITRSKDSMNRLNRSRQIIEGENGMVAFLCGAPCTFSCLLETREHSLDGGKTWLPCGVEEAKP